MIWPKLYMKKDGKSDVSCMSAVHIQKAQLFEDVFKTLKPGKDIRM
jgi:hypothetical protein